MCEYRLCPATEADAEDICAMEAALFSDPWSEAALRSALSAAQSLCLVAKEGTRAVGYLLLRQIPPEGELYRIGVLPTHRRRGIGRALLCHALSLLPGQGTRTLFLEVRRHNAPAIGLYEALGFAPIGQRKNYYRHPTEDAVIYRLDIEDRA